MLSESCVLYLTVVWRAHDMIPDGRDMATSTLGGQLNVVNRILARVNTIIVILLEQPAFAAMNGIGNNLMTVYVI